MSWDGAFWSELGKDEDVPHEFFGLAAPREDALIVNARRFPVLVPMMRNNQAKCRGVRGEREEKPLAPLHDRPITLQTTA